jgi:WD40 repeat protein
MQHSPAMVPIATILKLLFVYLCESWGDEAPNLRALASVDMKSFGSLRTAPSYHRDPIPVAAPEESETPKWISIGSIKTDKEAQKIHSFDWSNDGKNIVVGQDDCSAKIHHASGQSVHWKEHPENLASRQPTGDLTCSTHMAVAYSPDATKLFSGGWWKAAIIYDMLKNEVAVHFVPGSETKNGPIQKAIWAPDGSKILTLGKKPDDAHIWGPADEETSAQWKILSSLNPTTTAANGEDEVVLTALTASWSPDSKRIVTGGVTNEAIIFESNGQLVAKLKTNGHTAQVNEVAWSPDGNYIATASDDGTVKVWKIESESKHDVIETVTSTETDSPEMTAVAWSADGKLLMTGNAKGRVSTFVRDGEKFTASWTHDIPDAKIETVVMALTGREILVAYTAKDSTTHHTFKIELLKNIPDDKCDSKELCMESAAGVDLNEVIVEDTLKSLSWHPDANAVLATNAECSAPILFTFGTNWDISNGLNGRDTSGSNVGQCKSHMAVAYSPTGESAFIGGWLHKSLIFTSTGPNTKNLGEMVWGRPATLVYRKQDQAVESVKWSPDGTILAIVSIQAGDPAKEDQYSVTLWMKEDEYEWHQTDTMNTTKSGAFDETLPSPKGHEGLVIAWSPVAHGVQQYLYVWNRVQAVSPDGKFAGPKGKISKGTGEDSFPKVGAATFSPDGKKLVVAFSPPKTDALWAIEPPENTEVTCWAADSETKSITALDWSPNGHLIAAGLADGTIQIRSYEGPEGKTILEKKLDARIRYVKWAGNGREVLVGQDNEVISLFALWSNAAPVEDDSNQTPQQHYNPDEQGHQQPTKPTGGGSDTGTESNDGGDGGSQGTGDKGGKAEQSSLGSVLLWVVGVVIVVAGGFFVYQKMTEAQARPPSQSRPQEVEMQEEQGPL